MVFDTLVPHPALRAYVREHRVIYFQFDKDKQPPAKTYPPRPEVTLSFYPYDREWVHYSNGRAIGPVRSALVGQHDEVNFRHVGHNFLIIQVVFQPGALFGLTGMPAAGLVNQYIDGEDVLGKPLKILNDQLEEMTDVPTMVMRIESYLLRLAAHTRVVRHAIDQVNKSMLFNLSHSVDDLADAACLSAKQFERKFVERVGLPPKYFTRIIRFATAYRIRNQQPDLDWLAVALACQYYDYQHLVKDFKAFTMLTPTRFEALDRQAPEREFGTSDTF